MLDVDLARLYGVPTSALNQAVKRNVGRFPLDFAFRLTAGETDVLKSQIVISSRHGGRRRSLPLAFTKQGVAMLSSVLRSPRAIAVNVPSRPSTEGHATDRVPERAVARRSGMRPAPAPQGSEDGAPDPPPRTKLGRSTGCGSGLPSRMR
jgi:ORF6N domain